MPADAAPPSFDLQSHSTHSDGALAPADVVARAAAAGVALLALTDHDTTSGVAEAAEAARATGIAHVSAVEITTNHENRQDLHLLGYLVDPTQAALIAALARSREDRERRAGAMADRLRELGFELDRQLLDERAAQGKAIGRPHLAEAVVRHPANRERLHDAGQLEPTAFLVAYLIDGAPAFVPRHAPSVAEAIELVHGAGGVAVWAHPFWDIADTDGVLAAARSFQDAGLDGIEIFYPSHDEAHTRLLAEHCAAHGLLTTGSADFHGPGHHTFDRFRAFSLYGIEPNLGPIAG